MVKTWPCPRYAYKQAEAIEGVYMIELAEDLTSSTTSRIEARLRMVCRWSPRKLRRKKELFDA